MPIRFRTLVDLFFDATDRLFEKLQDLADSAVHRSAAGFHGYTEGAGDSTPSQMFEDTLDDLPDDVMEILDLYGQAFLLHMLCHREGRSIGIHEALVQTIANQFPGESFTADSIMAAVKQNWELALAHAVHMVEENFPEQEEFSAETVIMFFQCMDEKTKKRLKLFATAANNAVGGRTREEALTLHLSRENPGWQQQEIADEVRQIELLAKRLGPKFIVPFVTLAKVSPSVLAPHQDSIYNSLDRSF